MWTSVYICKMKVALFIFSLYLLFLTAIPCCSFDNCPEDKIKTEQTADHKTGDDDCGNCSPFFSCNACTGNTFTATFLNFQFIFLSTDRAYAGYIASAIPVINYDFWQPPKLA